MNNVIIHKACVVRDVNSIYDYFELHTPYLLNPGMKLKINDQDQEYVIVLESYNDGKVYVSRCVSESQHNILLSTYNPVNIQGDLKKFLSNFGVKYLIDNNTQSVRWVSDKCQIPSIIEYCNNNTQVIDGGAPFVTMNVNGNFILTDIKYNYDNLEPKVLPYTCRNDVINIGWMNAIPSKVLFTTCSDDGIKTEKIEMSKIGTTSRMTITDNTGEYRDAAIRKYKNSFNRYKYLSRCCTFNDDFGVCRFGDHVILNDGYLHGVVTKFKCFIPLNCDFTAPEITISAPYTL